MKKFSIILILFILLGCDDNNPKPEEYSGPYPEQLEFSLMDFTFNYNQRNIDIECSNSAEWYIASVSEIATSDTTIYHFDKKEQVSGNWFTIDKEKNKKLFSLNLAENKMPEIRNLIIRVESEYSEGEDIHIKQYPGFLYIEEDPDIKNQLVGKWLIIADDWFGWIEETDESRATVAEFTAEGFYKEAGSDYRRYKVSKDYICFKVLNSEDDYNGIGVTFNDEWICKYQFDGNKLKVELVMGAVASISGYLYKRTN
ncbi:MAG: hypothetical protein LBV74_11150 [Tannerella sp.]|jgi:hypothetical protein|nr:hypothetical protein [Tannerella sp.]